MKKMYIMIAVCMILTLFAFSSVAESTLSYSSADVNADGSINISWSYSGNSNPVSYLLISDDHPAIDHVVAGMVEDSPLTLYELIPGYEYSVLFLNESLDVIDVQSVSIPSEDFTDLKSMKFTDLGIVKFDTGKFKEGNIVQKPSAAKLCQNMESGSKYQLYIKMTTPSIAKGERKYNALLAVTAPNGYTDTVASEFVLESDRSLKYWTWFPLSLSSFYEESALTAGTYRVSYYLDGKLVDSKTLELY